MTFSEAQSPGKALRPPCCSCRITSVSAPDTELASCGQFDPSNSLMCFSESVGWWFIFLSQGRTSLCFHSLYFNIFSSNDFFFSGARSSVEEVHVGFGGIPGSWPFPSDRQMVSNRTLGRPAVRGAVLSAGGARARASVLTVPFSLLRPRPAGPKSPTVSLHKNQPAFLQHNTSHNCNK